MLESWEVGKLECLEVPRWWGSAKGLQHVGASWISFVIRVILSPCWCGYVIRVILHCCRTIVSCDKTNNYILYNHVK